MGVERDEPRRVGRRMAALSVPLGVALVVGGLVQHFKVSETGRPSTPAGGVVALLLGALLIVFGLRRRYVSQRTAEARSSASGAAGAGTAVPQDVVTAEEVLAQVRVEILPGFTPRAEVAERVCDYFQGYAGPTGLADVSPLVEAVWSQRLLEEPS